MSDVIPAPQQPRIPVRSQQLPSDSTFPVRRIYCVGRNFAEHAREMGAAVPTSAADRGSPVFFCKPADAIVLDGVVPYPRGTRDLHHEGRAGRGDRTRRARRRARRWPMPERWCSVTRSAWT
jgi:2-keto-4-pentenoate hydratase/2-oxohepta-3-ene-1,7-dioic acid hydratase in catechol pathway